MTPPVRVRLRDATMADADVLDQWVAHPAAQGEFNDFGMPRTNSFRESLAKGPLRDDTRGEMLVERVADTAPIGTVSWHRVQYGPNAESAVWNIGISLIPEARGHGYGGEAQRQLADYLFATTSVNRVEAQTDVDNLAEQRALEKAGFIREGIARGAQFRAGAYHDLVTYSRVRSDD